MSHLDHVMYEHRYYGRDVTYADLLKIKEEVENRQPQPERQALQAEGNHPAPCARFCEATAFNIKIRGLEAQLKALAQPQPVKEPVKGWWAHTCPEDGKVDVVNYQLTPADKRAGWVEHEVYTSPQAKPQPAQPLSDEQITEGYKNGLFAKVGLHHYFACGVRFAEIQHGIQPLTAITKGTT